MSTACNSSLQMARLSMCPAAAWLDLSSQPLIEHSALHRLGRPLTMVNVGANKGYNVAAFLQLFHARASPAPTNAAWHAALLREPSRVRYACGLCNSCRAPPPRARHHVRVEVHAVELVGSNARTLRRLFRAFGVPGAAHHLALSNFSGISTYAPQSAVGLEHIELGSRGGAARAEQVRVDTLDAFAAKQGLEEIALLSIDAEGQDALVLEGAEGMLSTRRVAIVEFEYVGRGFWRQSHEQRRSLLDVLAKLAGHGYSCFWQANNGRLASVEPGLRFGCRYDFRFRSNLLLERAPPQRLLRVCVEGEQGT
ncbi:hypothetical protein AB1Y20_003713 [Prymnesium parvum]|uniref:Methyltransferase FkbM domain-containing protein n=1 Tax=Prymnesium parvum TaxID=97485 RepID=A0AB34J5J3_PRYPA